MGKEQSQQLTFLLACWMERICNQDKDGPPGATISKRPTKHNYATTTISPSLIAIVVVLGSTLLVVNYYKIFAKYCKASRWRPFFKRRRGSLDSKENIQVYAYSQEGFQFQDEGWQIITQSNGLDEAVIRSIPLCR